MKDFYLINDNEDFDEWYDKYALIYKIDRRLTYLESIIDQLNLENRRKCPICGESCIEFEPFGSLLFITDQCPHCGSLARQRSLYLIMEREMNILNETKNIKILHFAPEPPIYMLFDEKDNVDYVPVDLNKENFKKELFFFTRGVTSKYFKDSQNYIKEEMDVQDIPYEDNTFDYLIINHVLEHVPQDKKAMSEIYRVLKPGGAALISVPIGGKITNEDERINTPELRLKYYDDSTHLRLYGRDLKEKLEDCGFEVEEYFNEEYYSKEEKELYNLPDDEYQYVCNVPFKKH
jgi:SAM-dependent methyltransferase